MEWVSCKEQNLAKKVKLPAYRAGLPGKVISLHIVPLDPTYPALSGRGTFRPIEILLRLHPPLGFQVVFPEG